MKWRAIVAGAIAFILFGSANPDPYPDDYFESPLGIPLYLAGSFAEMRSNHFHGGLDMKTQGHAGYPVYAAADGWVSRVAVSPGGYGNALYLSHQNGYMTVYGHLDRFSENIQLAVKERQYAEERFDVQMFPDRGRFPVLKGELIAYSGNSGGSSGPHLHFEIRDERTGWPMNPLLWGFDVKDTIKPRIYRFKVYALGTTSRIRLRDSRTGGWRIIEAGESAFVELIRNNGSIVMQCVDRIEASGPIGIGVQTHDFHDGSNNLLGQYKIRVLKDDESIFESVLERFAFDQTRFINAHVDYAERSSSGRWVQRGFVLPGNELPMYETKDEGVFTVTPGDVSDIDVQVEDAYGNAAGFSFDVFGTYSEDSSGIDESSEVYRWSHEELFTYRARGFTLRAPAGALYDDIQFHYSELPAFGLKRPVYSALHSVHDRVVPVHKPLSLEISAPDLPEELHDKAVIAQVSSNGSLSWAGGEWNGRSVKTSVRSFGTFVVTVDDDPPEIRPLNISPGKNMASTGEIRIRIRDGFSGIRSYRGTIDGEWVLFEYDAKYQLLRHRFENDLPRGSHMLEMTVTDNKGNTASREILFTR